IQSRPLYGTRLDTLTQLDRLIRADGTQHRGEARLEELLHLRGRAFPQPLDRVALGNMTMRVDETGHERPALRVDRLDTCGRARCTGRHRRDLAGTNDQGPALDHAALPIDNTGVDDRQVLCRGTARRCEER